MGPGGFRQGQSRGEATRKVRPQARISPALPGKLRIPAQTFTGKKRASNHSLREIGPRGPGRGRTRGCRRSDHRIYEEVCDRLMEHECTDAGGIEVRFDVEFTEGVVSLRGFVVDRRTRYEAEDVAQSFFGVRQVRNKLKMG